MHLYVEPMDAVVIDVSEDGRIRLANEDWSQPTLQERRAVIYAARQIRQRLPGCGQVANVVGDRLLIQRRGEGLLEFTQGKFTALKLPEELREDELVYLPITAMTGGSMVGGISSLSRTTLNRTPGQPCQRMKRILPPRHRPP